MDSRLSAEAGARPAGRLPAQASAPVVSISPPHQAAILSPRKSPQTTPVPKNIEGSWTVSSVCRDLIICVTAKKTSNFFERLFSGTSKAVSVLGVSMVLQTLMEDDRISSRMHEGKYKNCLIFQQTSKSCTVCSHTPFLQAD